MHCRMSAFSPCRCCLLVFLVLQAVVFSGVSTTDASHDITITVASPNITILQGKPFLCFAVDIPKGEYVLTRIVPRPVPGVYFHMVVSLCDKRFHENQDGVWDCGSAYDEPMIPRLPRLPFCSPASGEGEFPHFMYQFQGGSVDEGSLIMPHGTGVPVGDDSDIRSMVLMFHFLKPEDLINGWTTGSAIDVTLRPVTRRTPILAVYTLNLETYGYAAANAVSTVSGSWTLKDAFELKLVLLYVHWHDIHSMLTDIQVWIERKSGGRDVILCQDPHAFAGITDVSNMTSGVVREGDRLVLQCTYNNTRNGALRVESDEVCIIHVFYTMIGKPLPEAKVFSVDPVYKNCFPDPMFNLSSWQFNYDGRSSYQGAGGDSCPVTSSE